MQESTVQFKLNMPSSLRDRIGEAAEKSGRSLTAEIIARLEGSFETSEKLEDILATYDELWVKVEKLEEMVAKHDQRLNPSDYQWLD
ncbi:Arc family DNA-binding protein [Mangrovicoccus sp. HB161399]|uniref:Arc family DNA-binding protein n=1 Tax=Mangrovicoccus sp. HB161399 TaxID=2720392 RepID=UPI00155740C5|nr:Arc family DNA-binding protein [Mangrovicoccus sp. HB161399]